MFMSIENGTNFLTAAYDLLVINLVCLMLEYHKELPENTDLVLKIGAQLGAIIGQLLFGYLANRYGRRKVETIQTFLFLKT